MRWEVTFDGRTSSMVIAGFRAHFVYSTRVDADTREEAIEAAKVKRDEAGFGDHKRLRSVERVYRYEVTLRSKTDRRRRETFVGQGRHEKEAVRYVQDRSIAAVRFAGYFSSTKRDKENVVKVVQVG